MAPSLPTIDSLCPGCTSIFNAAGAPAIALPPSPPNLPLRMALSEHMFTASHQWSAAPLSEDGHPQPQQQQQQQQQQFSSVSVPHRMMGNGSLVTSPSTPSSMILMPTNSVSTPLFASPASEPVIAVPPPSDISFATPLLRLDLSSFSESAFAAHVPIHVSAPSLVSIAPMPPPPPPPPPPQSMMDQYPTSSGLNSMLVASPPPPTPPVLSVSSPATLYPNPPSTFRQTTIPVNPASPQHSPSEARKTSFPVEPQPKGATAKRRSKGITGHESPGRTATSSSISSSSSSLPPWISRELTNSGSLTHSPPQSPNVLVQDVIVDPPLRFPPQPALSQHQQPAAAALFVGTEIPSIGQSPNTKSMPTPLPTTTPTTTSSSSSSSKTNKTTDNNSSSEPQTRVELTSTPLFTKKRKPYDSLMGKLKLVRKTN